MKWDMFISYASEDAPFVRSLADALQRAGLRTWFDQFALTAGDGLLDSIDRGLRDSRYGIVILSEHFLSKNWPRRELAGLLALEADDRKVIIPVWYQITLERVRESSPLLADKVAVKWSGNMSEVVDEILRVILLDQASAGQISPLRQMLPDGTEVICLPVRPTNDFAVAIGRNPVSNLEYKRFVEARGYPSPYGCMYREGQWVNGFDPWSDPRFADPHLPVVCVDFWDVWRYCAWASHDGVDVFVPNVTLWELAASGGRADRQVDITSVPENAHQKATAPCPKDQSGTRANSAGVSDMFGNVWEWCCEDQVAFRAVSAIAVWRPAPPAIRGGGFRDDLSIIEWRLGAEMLPKGERSKHDDIGFRLAVKVPLELIEPDARRLLERQPPLPDRFWRVLADREDYERSSEFMRQA
jgi:hypothetical protein